MRVEQTDDYWYIIYNTFKGDAKLIEDLHFTSPSGLLICTNHTHKDIMERTMGEVLFFAVLEDNIPVMETKKGIELYNVKNGGLIGFACFDKGGDRLFSFGVRKEHRRQGIIPLFLMELRKFAKEGNLTLLVTENNERDLAVLREMGMIEHGSDYTNSEKILKWDSLEGR